MDTITNEKGWPACGRSMENAGLLTKFEVHFAPEAEQAQNHGMCAQCAAKIRKHHRRVQDGRDEQPAFIEKRHEMSVETDHVGREDNGEALHAVDFDYDALDADTAEFFASASPDVRRETAMALGLILAWIWHTGFESAQRKFAAMSAGLRPDLLDDASYEEIGSKLGCVKATIAKSARNFQQKFNFRFTRSRQDESRARMAEAARGHGWRDTRKRTRPSETKETPP